MNNYHIYDEIGRGKYSVVYKGRKKKSFEYLAVKSVEKTRRKKILNEVKIMHSLDNEYILKFYNWYETRNHLWIIFEYCAGGSLNSIIESDKKLPESMILTFASNILKALFYLHSNGIIYGHLHPHTILFTEYGILKLGDFGLSKRAAEMTLVENNSEKKGTPFYMAPELFQDDGVLSYYSDFWSLGCLLYELATGQPPFMSNSLQELVQKILSDSVQNIPGCSQEFNSLVAELLQKDCSKRISWGELKVHKVWGSEAEIWEGVMPPQPLYEAYLVSKGLTQRTTTIKPATSHILNVDVVRISQTIHKNLLRESREYLQAQSSDVKLGEKDQILDFAQYKNEEESEKEQGEVEVVEEESKGEKKTEPEQKAESFRPMTIQGKAREITSEDNSHQRANSAQTALTRTLSKGPAINELIIHSSDNTVKPIVGNKEIDKPLELNYSSQTFGFQVWSQEEVLTKSETQQLEDHFHIIFTAISSSGVDKQNLLSYFESLILNSAVANKLINSGFIGVFIKLLKTSKISLLKARVCSILGQLLRHSTLINIELSQSGLLQALSELLKEKNEKLSRKAMAALGEYLFYAATQMDDHHGEWEIPSAIFLLVGRTLRLAEDEALKFYACKTIENICAQSQKAGTKFANAEVMGLMIGIYNTSRYESFRTSAVVAISHMVRLNASLISGFIEKFPMKNAVTALNEEQPRIQQAVLTIVLYVFINESKYMAGITEDRNFGSCLISLLESSAIVIRGKTILVLFFIIKHNQKALNYLSELKFFAILDKFVRDSHKYVQNCILHLLEHLAETALQGLKILYENIKKGVKSQGLQTVIQIINSPACLSKISFKECLQIISECLNISKSGNLDLLSQVFAVLEAIIVNTSHLTHHCEYLISQILPVLLSIMNSNDIDARFRSLKIFSDILLPFIYEDSVYSSGNNKTAVAINEMVTKTLLPIYSNILNDVDPIPLYSLKLLSALLEKSMDIVSTLKKLKLIPIIIENFQGGNPRLNLHLISVINKIIESHELTLEELGELGLIEKVSSVMRVIQEQDWCVEKMLDILYELLVITADTLRTKRSDHLVLKITEPLSENFVSCTKILKLINEISVAEKSANCLSLLLQLYAHKIATNPTQEILNALMAVIEIEKPSLQRRVLRVIKSIMAANISLIVPADVFAKLKNTNDKEIADMISEIYRE